MYRLGKKQKRAVLDSKGIEVVVFPKRKELYAELFVEFLNKFKSEDDLIDFNKKAKLLKLFSQRENIEAQIREIDEKALINYELKKLSVKD